jgi:hypothetical protein
MENNHRINFFIILIVICISGCAPRPMVTSTIGAIDRKNKLLIATQKSEFKEAIVSKVVKGFEENNIFIEVIDLANLSDKLIEDYKAIVILNDYKFFQINRNTKKFLKNVNDYERRKIVLLTTAGSPKLMIKSSEVDAISSASKISNTDTISDKIIQKVNTILSE